MQIGNFEISFLKKKEEKKQPQQSESAYSYSMLYGLLQGISDYNPDTLLGVKGLGIYKKMAEDEQVKVVARFRRNSITGRGWVFKFEKDTNISEAEQEKRIKIFEEIVNQMPGSFRRSLNGIMSSMRYGYSLTEKTFKPINVEGSTYWGIKRLRTKPSDTFLFEVDQFGELKNLKQRVDGKERTLDINRFIHHVHNPEEHEYYGQSELREAYRSWWSKDVLIRLWNIYIERMAGGLVWAKPETQADGVQRGTQQHTDLMNVLNNIQTKTGILLPSGYELHMESPTNTDAFNQGISFHDLAIAKALLMPDKLGFSSTGDNGSRALGETQLEAFLWLLDAEAADLEETLNEQLFSELGAYNFADGVYPKFTFKPLSQAMINAVASIWKDLVSAGAVTPTDTDEDHIRDLLHFPDKGEDEIRRRDPRSDNLPPPAVIATENEDPEYQDPDKKGVINETILGNDFDTFEYNRRVFTKAMRRVDFAKIDTSSNVALIQGVNRLNENMEELLKWAVDQINEGIMERPEDVAELKAPSSILKGLRKSSNEVLSNGWDLGINHAKQELEKAGQKQLSKEQFKRFTSLGHIAVGYFEAKSFDMAGRLSNDALSKIKNIILQGIKYSKTTTEIINEIYRAFGQEGLLDRETLEILLGEALEYENTKHRLETTVRTVMFEAINEARYEYFTSDIAGGFVTALEYSAILDGRTTSICQELDGKVYLARANEWDLYRPPNHYNCRSLLIPVTARDEVEVSTESPELAPQDGFG